MPGRGEHRRTASKRVGVVVVAGDRPRPRRPCRAARAASSQTTALRLGRRRGRLEDVAGDDDEVDRLVVGDRRRSRRARRGARRGGDSPLQHLADVPVGGVEDLHARSRQAGERVVGRRADVAPPARHRCVSDGPGGPRRERELDHQRHRDLGLAHEHRARLGDRGPLAVRRRAGTRTRAGPPRRGRAGRRPGSPSWR